MLTALIFIATYTVVAIGRLPGTRITRTGGALGGAALMIVTGAIAPHDALASIDWRTIVLLLVMMAFVAPLQLAGIFSRVVVWVGRRVHHPAVLLAAVAAASGVLSGYSSTTRSASRSRRWFSTSPRRAATIRCRISWHSLPRRTSAALRRLSATLRTC